MGRFEHIDSITDSLCLRSGDLPRRNKGIYLDCANDVYLDLNLTTIKMTKRELFQVNKRTNSVDLPSNNMGVFEVSVMDHKGAIWPMYLNDSIYRDIPQVSAAKNCACENQCGYSLCNLVKGYEAVVSTQSDILPNGSPVSFQCINRVSIGKNGIVYKETQGIQRVFTNGVWTDTILVTTSTEMCQCEIDVNGCICDTEQNENSLCLALGLPTNDGIPFGGDANSFYGNPNVNTWRYFASSQLQ